MLWYYYDGNGGDWNTILCRDEGTYHHLLINTGSEIGFFNSGWYSSLNKLNLHKWHNLILVKNGTNSKLYINGNLVQNDNNSFDNNTYPLRVIGNYGGYSQGAFLG